MKHIDSSSIMCLLIGIICLVFRKQYVELITRYNLWRSNSSLKKWRSNPSLKKQIEQSESFINSYVQFMVFLGGLIFLIVGLMTALGVWKFRK
jgi:hypothetical protein